MSGELQKRTRTNKGRRLWKELKPMLEMAADEQIADERLISIDATARLKSQFVQRLKDSSKVWRMKRQPSRVDDIWTAIREIGEGLVDREVVLFHRFDEFTGAVRMPDARHVLSRAARLWETVDRDLNLATDGARDGICVAFDHYADRDEYELAAWGIFARAAN